MVSTLVIGLVVLSAILHAFRDFLTKKAKDKQIFAWFYGSLALVFFFPFFIYFLFTEGINSLTGMYIVTISAIVQVFYVYFLTKSYDHGDLSHVYPIMRSAPALVLIFAIIFLKEQASFLGVLGIVFVVLGAYTINMKKLSVNELFAPIQLMFKDASTKFAFLTLISLTVISLLDKVGVSYIHPIIYIWFLFLISSSIFTFYIFHVKTKDSIKEEWKINKKLILIGSFIAIFGYSLILIAFTIERVSYVVGLRQLSVVFAVILGIYLLKEKYKGIRFSAAALIFIGAFFDFNS